MCLSTVIKKTEPSLTLADRRQYFEEMKNPLLREKAAENYVRTFEVQIRAIARQSTWGKQWGYEDAYQHAVTFVLERAIVAENPNELPRRLDICNAIKEEAARQIYMLSLSPYVIKKYNYNNNLFDSDCIVSDPSNQPQIFDELTWHRIRKLAEGHLEGRDLRLLKLFTNSSIPGRIPPIEEIATYLCVKLETAKRYVRQFKQKMRQIPELVTMYKEIVGQYQEESPLQEQLVLAIASEKVVSMVQWRRAKIGRVLEQNKTTSLALRQALKIAMLQEDAYSLSAQLTPHPSVRRRYQQQENILLRALNKPLNITESNLEESLEVLTERISRGRPWNDWNFDTGGKAA